MSKYAIVVENVVKKYPMYHHINAGIKNVLLRPRSLFKFLTANHYTALNGVSFKVKKGDSVALIGNNGAGKSTMLAMIAGVLKPTSGKILVDGRVASMLELGGGFHPELTGRENIRLNATLLGLTKKEVDERLNSIIEFSELGPFIEQPIRIYSSGMLAKLGFAVITSCNPDILIIDEVLSVGDYKFQQKCLNVIKEFKESGVTIFLVSHSLEDVKAFCDNAIWIDNHKVKAIGKANHVAKLYLSAQ